jgi:hypothetical protein
MKAYLLGGALLCCAGTNSHAQYCHVPGFNAVDNGVAVGYMTVKSGRLCGVARLGGDGGAIASTRIVSPPRAGRVGLTPVAVRYMPAPGYIGPDSFAFQNHGRDRFGQPTVRTIQVRVTVVP